MTISLSSKHLQFVEEQVRSGRFSSVNEVVQAGLDRLSEDDELRAALQIGVDQIARGEVGPFDPWATLARVEAARATQETKP